MAGARLHARTVTWLLQTVCGTRFEVRGRQNLVRGRVIIAAKHQSAWDTIALIPLFRDPSLVMKAELLRLPLYGAFCRKFEMIPVQREAGGAALRGLARDAGKRLDDEREVLIFPEGTRRMPGATPDYKPGVAFLYGQLNVPVSPVALNSGVFWPRHSFLRYPGTIVVEFLDPIAPGLPRDTFAIRLQDEIEAATARLVAEAL